jgi:hypothetical protein
MKNVGRGGGNGWDKETEGKEKEGERRREAHSDFLPTPPVRVFFRNKPG